ncbi:MAG: RNA methyltransferase [Candidatus Delongbacteria bacterium]|nr:RNA methyltransferase [Candidatus Delongbacteria bacterium]MCG2761162.1 RNA methyltransferase [Candidatus Delongbacteria bacterium]
MKEIITSLQNAKIKELVRFRAKNGKTGENDILIEDEREIIRAIDAGIEFKETFICEEILENKDKKLLNKISKLSKNVYFLSKAVFEKVAYKNDPFGIIIKAEFRASEFSDIDPECSFILVAESIEKPGNLGALIRTADGAGIDTIILADKITDYRNPNVIRASTGTIFSKKIIEASTEDTIKFLKANKFQTVSADPYSKTVYSDTDFTKKTAVVVGSEAFGLSESMKKNADILVSIPMKGVADSLNVNQAATIFLYEALRQRS